MWQWLSAGLAVAGSSQVPALVGESVGGAGQGVGAVVLCVAVLGVAGGARQAVTGMKTGTR